MTTDRNSTRAAGAERWRIAFIARRFGSRFGGAEAYAEHLLAELVQRHDVHVFCQHYDSPLPLPHTVLPRRRGLPRWLNLWHFTRQCAPRVADFDIVHSHENAPPGHIHGVHVVPVRYSRRDRDRSFGKRLATTLSPRLQAYLRLEAQRFAPAPGKWLVAASGRIDEQIAAVYAHTASREVITPGVQLPARLPTRADARSQLRLPHDARIAVLVANDPWRKGFASVLQAMRAPGVPWHVLVVGGADAMVERVRAAARQAGLDHRVHAWPAQAPVWPFYAAADFCVFPTLGDAFGMVPLEAMACGLPVIVSDAQWCGFAAHLVHREHALLLADPRDPAGLVTAVTQLHSEFALAPGLARRGAELARQFSWPAIAARYETLYRRSLQSR